MGRGTHQGHQAPIRAGEKIDEHDLAGDRQGLNKLQANDQASVRAPRHSAPKAGGATGKNERASRRPLSQQPRNQQPISQENESG
jgi:hypothetical protein